MHSINPATGELFAEYNPHSPAIVEARLDAAEEAFHSWKETSLKERARLFKTLASNLRKGSNAFAYTMTVEMGKPIAQARSEVEKCAWVCEYFADQAASFLSPESISTEATESQIAFEPLGPIFAIMPWNFPFWQVFRFAAPTLMAGNVALLKHAPNVLGCATHIVDLFEKSGFPAGVFQKLFIPVDVAAEVIADPRVRAVTLTGSTGAGRSVAKAAGKALKPCVLELGGSDPFIVLEDADLDLAVEKALSSRMMNNGQSCIAAKRFILEAPIYQAFLEKLRPRIEAMNQGDPLQEETDIGPIARDDLRQELHRQVQDSIEAGARCLLGGEIPEGPGFFYPPTLLVDVTPGMAAFDEETFGPLAALIKAENADHAIELANQSTYGLGASIWTTRKRGRQLAGRLQAGAVSVNEIVKSDPRLPFGGIKDSGFGRELSRYGLLAFTNIKSIWIE